jgi:hypothetical protein
MHLMALTDGYQAVMRLANDREKSEMWLPVVAAAYRQAVRTTPYGGEFAGAWVLGELGGWVPNLRLLAALEIIEKSGDSTRGGRRAYYRMPDVEGVKRALVELRLLDQ